MYFTLYFTLIVVNKYSKKHHFYNQVNNHIYCKQCNITINMILESVTMKDNRTYGNTDLVEEGAYQREPVSMRIICVSLAVLVLLALCLHITSVLGVNIPLMSLQTIQYLMVACTIVIAVATFILIFRYKKEV